jgi:hypothetical protein
MWRILVMFTSLRLPLQADIISLEESALTVISAAGINETQFILHVKGPIFLPYFKQIGILQTNFHMSTHYQVSQKSVQRERN